MDKAGKKRILITAAAAVLLLAAFQGGKRVGAAQNTPGSLYDPLITQSYLEGRLAQAANAGFTKVTLEKNKVLSLETGGQLVLYAGTAYASGTEGLVDMTAGNQIKKDISVMKFHLCMAPVNGSGIKATTSCTVYVTGEYTVRE